MMLGFSFTNVLKVDFARRFVNTSNSCAASEVKPTMKTQYCTDFLKEINTRLPYNGKISSVLHQFLKHLGILRAPRGCRSGKSVKRKSNKNSKVMNMNIQTFTQRCVSFRRKSRINLSNLIVPVLLDECTSRQVNSSGTLNYGRMIENNLSLCLLNCRSLKSKCTDFIDYVVDCGADIFALTETWLTQNDTAACAECTPSGFKLIHHPRVGRPGGGTAILYKDSMPVKAITSGEKLSFEYSEFVISMKSALNIRLVILYRPPYSERHPITTSVFFQELSVYLESLALSSEFLLVTGDFNIHVDDPSNYNTIKLNELLGSMGLQQHVITPTHESGHTLDLIITRECDAGNIPTPPTSDRFVSDHCSVFCHLDIAKPVFSSKVTSYRKLKSINMDALRSDLLHSELCQNPPRDLDKLVESYNSTLSSVLDKHAPLITKTTVIRPRVPWISDEIKKAKQERRKAERTWIISKRDCDRKVYKEKRNFTTFLMNKSRREFYTNFVTENSSDQRKLFKATKQLLNLNRENPLPFTTNKADLANRMGDFFIKKINIIRDELDKCSDTAPISVPCEDYCVDRTSATMTQFVTLESKDIADLISKSSSKSCLLDPMPTSLVKECKHILSPVISSMVNLSLQNSHFPQEWKQALVTPILKKPGADPIPANYRPISNLPFVSKLTEKVVASKMHSYLTENDLYPAAQSAYRPFHSTETALLKVMNDILMNMNQQRVTLLVLLDLSAAFDTVDHSVLLARLQHKFGITQSALSWFKSYLSDRSQKISIGNVHSTNFILDCGVPQGSCLGPLLFIIYTSELLDIIKHHLPEVQCYADDTQLHISFKPADSDDESRAITAMELCIKDVKRWMLLNRLKLNEDKTEFLLIGTRQQLLKVHIEDLNVGDCSVPPSSLVRNLGSWMDSHLSMSSHISKTCSSIFYFLHNIRRIRKYLSRSTTETLVHAFISSRLDYCNCLLYGLPSTQINKLQRAQNAAARLICNVSRFHHITPILKDLHWLPVKSRIIFKIVLITFKTLHGLAPSYLQSLVKIKQQSKYQLRSNDKPMLLEIPKVKSSKTLGDRAFEIAAPTLWNNLPPVVRVMENFHYFKQALKTLLFNQHFNS